MSTFLHFHVGELKKTFWHVVNTSQKGCHKPVKKSLWISSKRHISRKGVDFWERNPSHFKHLIFIFHKSCGLRRGSVLGYIRPTFMKKGNTAARATKAALAQKFEPILRPVQVSRLSWPEWNVSHWHNYIHLSMHSLL